MTQSATSETRLPSFSTGIRALVCGASGGIGAAFVRALAADARVAAVYAAARRPAALDDTQWLPRVTTLPFDLTDEASIAALLARATADGPLHLVIVATGVLHDGETLRPEKSWRSLDAAALARAFAINTTGPALIAKHALGALARDSKSVFATLSARCAWPCIRAPSTPRSRNRFRAPWIPPSCSRRSIPLPRYSVCSIASRRRTAAVPRSSCRRRGGG